MKPEKLQRHYEVHGLDDPNAECVLILAGLGAGASMFHSAIDVFKSKFKIIIVSSPAIEGATWRGWFSVPRMTKTVQDILALEGVKKCHVVGHSMGGMMAQQLYKNDDSLFQSLVLMSSNSGGYSLQNHVPNFFKAAFGDAPVKDFLNKAKQDPLYPLIFSFSKRFYKERPRKFKSFCSTLTCAGNNRILAVAHLLAVCQFCLTPNLKNINVPTLVMHGNEDNILPLSGALQIASLIPNARLLKLDECGHYPFVEYDTIYDTIHAFITQEMVLGEEVTYSTVDGGDETVYISPYNQLFSMLKEAFNYMRNRKVETQNER